MNLKYYPYFRGRQFELLALRELVSNGRLSRSVVPIVEPVKLSSTLLTTFRAFAETEHGIGLVRNPEYGDVVGEMKKLPVNERIKFSAVFQSNNVLQVILQNKGLVGAVNLFKKRIQKDPGRWGALYSSAEFLDLSLAQGVGYGVNLIPDATKFRRRISGPKVLFHDCFNKRDRNADYQDNDNELFSDDHTYAEDENYVGTGDYSIIGNEYSESGFAPYAVAIHVVYESPDGSGVLRVAHFISDSNDGYDDPAGKFMEAAGKLARWVKTKRIAKTHGLDQLLESYETAGYPGLGSLKKFAIMHHLELMGRILER